VYSPPLFPQKSLQVRLNTAPILIVDDFKLNFELREPWAPSRVEDDTTTVHPCRGDRAESVIHCTLSSMHNSR
jgi:hypothetical protein